MGSGSVRASVRAIHAHTAAHSFCCVLQHKSVSGTVTHSTFAHTQPLAQTHEIISEREKARPSIQDFTWLLPEGSKGPNN